jgi:hypothetical protein
VTRDEEARAAVLRLVAVAYRVDRLLELASDFADVIVAYGTGRVGPSPVWHAARLVAREAAAVALATAGPDDWEDDGEDDDWDDGEDGDAGCD